MLRVLASLCTYLVGFVVIHPPSSSFPQLPGAAIAAKGSSTERLDGSA